MVRRTELQQQREACRALVRRRALFSAGAAVVPVPFFDMVVDAGILVQLIPEITRRFGLEPERIEALPEDRRARAWKIIRERGSQLLGIVVTREVVRRTFLDFAGRSVSRLLVRFVPLGGQLVSAGVGYFVMRKIAYRHVDDCYALALALAPDAEPAQKGPASGA
jgi:uncharacterized protein (DUF697 family)